MYKGKKTYFYNGRERLFDVENIECLVYDWEERDTWEVVIVLPGVEEIPKYTFNECDKIETVIMSDSVRRIEECAFYNCKSLSYVKLSRNLEFIAFIAFIFCESLTSIFIPPSCRHIGERAFAFCEKMIIFVVPQNTQLDRNVVQHCTALVKASPFEEDATNGFYSNYEVHPCVNGDTDEYALHRACSSYYPTTEIIYEIVKRQGLKAFQKQNMLGITPLQYLVTNPYADINQSTIIKRYVLEMMGEIA